MCDGKGKFGGAAICAKMAVMVVAQIAWGSAINDHRSLPAGRQGLLNFP